MVAIPENTRNGMEDPRNIMSCNIRIPYVAGNDHARTVIGSLIKRKSIKKPLKKMLASSNNIEY